MRNPIRYLIPIMIVGLIFFFLTGCTILSQVDIIPQSHFTYPNSNVEPLGTVSGSASILKIGVIDLSYDLIEKAYNDALAKKGGDLLINIKFTRKVDAIYLYIVTLYSTRIDIEATAAKADIGMQELSTIKNSQMGLLASGRYSQEQDPANNFIEL